MKGKGNKIMPINKIVAFLCAKHEKYMHRGQQKVEEYLINGGWELQKGKQGNENVWLCPLTGSNFLEPEALRRQDARPDEDKIVIAFQILDARREAAVRAHKAAMDEIERLTALLSEYDNKLAELTAGAEKAPSPTPAAAPAATGEPAKTS
jgi:hypothetical protein